MGKNERERETQTVRVDIRQGGRKEGRKEVRERARRSKEERKRVVLSVEGPRRGVGWWPGEWRPRCSADL